VQQQHPTPIDATLASLPRPQSPATAGSRPPRASFPLVKGASLGPAASSSSASTGSPVAQGRTQEGTLLSSMPPPSHSRSSAPRPTGDASPLSHTRQPKASLLQLSELPSQVGNLQEHQIGDELGEGDEKRVYRLKPPLDKFAVAAFHAPSGTLDETREALTELKRMGLPVVDYSEPIIVAVGGRQRQGVYMDYVEGAVSGKDLRTQKNQPAGVNATPQTFADLDAIESTLRNGGQGHGVAVWDLDLLIGKDGRVRLFDPAAVVPVDPQTGKGKSSLDENLKLIADLRSVLSTESQPLTNTT
jgi:hypothetical protein